MISVQIFTADEMGNQPWWKWKPGSSNIKVSSEKDTRKLQNSDCCISEANLSSAICKDSVINLADLIATKDLCYKVIL